MTALPVEDLAVDLLDPQVHSADPWPIYTWLREEAPVYWDPINALWAVSRYDDVIGVARDPETYTSTGGNLPKMPGDPSFINLDGPAHLARRGLLSHLFTKSAVDRLREHIRDAVDELIDEVIERGRCDLVADITRPLPFRIIAEMTGIPREHWDQVCDWMDVFVTGGNGPDHVTAEVNEAFVEFGGLHMMLVDARRDHPTDDLLSLWVHSDLGGGTRMDEDQILFEHTMMLVGGSETARNAASGGIEALCERPDQLRILLDEPDRMAAGAEECLRWVTPFIRMSRTVTREVELRGQLLEPGQEVLMLYPPANRDPRAFDAPDTFDVRRDFKKKMLAFGHGRHMCIGSHLARAEVQIVLEQLLRRMPDLQLDGEPAWSRSSFIRGPTTLPLRFTPGRRR